MKKQNTTVFRKFNTYGIYLLTAIFFSGLIASVTALAGVDGADYTACKSTAKEIYGEDVRVTLHKLKRSYVQMYVFTEDGKVKVNCDRDTLKIQEV
jgi:hypothetical protein